MTKGNHVMEFVIKYVNGHVEVYDRQGNFVFSADSVQEAEADLELIA